ncbi:50S ribosomal protein L18 [Flavobacterium sp. MMLR14_040]|jgi:large subunit ribosomal protein L18|uniref:Large ribosomal subunit protein uL18 n=1 Tax=Flavobacterium pectinovorum TaxID=29533 RepID=A0AB36P5E4_9FLAO|nr:MULTISPECIES: 50S ribosomal protein L18 [Flavobacterium]KIQ18675.1 50S ribosomal protein L18 [Flavobacterium sp. MEB061]MBP1224072.1 large subunit ribosomal protein L18 [Flavobacterium sp. 1355]MCI9843832.1 50S ribosomal protein L18 [Flavobacterium pectinovorum]MDW8849312.1 50S ribosomal protein L18 [Flavobacterium sp. MMLR14_040]OXB07553.1 50S ribosomal protein L18 [Flavobacterium pectinovorum]
MSLTKSDRRQRIRFRIRKSISGTATNPRLSVFRSNKEIYAQLIDDVNGVTLLAASSREKEIGKGTNVEIAAAVGKLVAEKALKAGIDTITFDRGGYLYHGRIKSLAEGARAAGLKF